MTDEERPVGDPKPPPSPGIPAVQLAEAGYADARRLTSYRTFAGERGGIFVRLYATGGGACTCLEYGHGMTLTRVTSPDCPAHGARSERGTGEPAASSNRPGERGEAAGGPSTY